MNNLNKIIKFTSLAILISGYNSSYSMIQNCSKKLLQSSQAFKTFRALNFCKLKNSYSTKANRKDKKKRYKYSFNNSKQAKNNNYKKPIIISSLTLALATGYYYLHTCK